MRGADIKQESVFSTVHPESFVPKNHPLRKIGELFKAAPTRLCNLQG
jgi:hypothetical protein